MSKFYAVKKGRKPGIYETWSECKIQVEGFGGAIYKAFTSYKEACEFIGLNFTDKNEFDSYKHSGYSRKEDSEVADIYVDGSYSNEYKIYSYGVVILYKNEIIKFSGKDNDKENISMRNVAGELLGAIEAMKWSLKNKIKSINLYYDYEGIEKWALGIWKTNKKGTKYYKKFFDNVTKEIDIKFKKVKAHTGILYNEEADRLAKLELRNINEANKDIANRYLVSVFNNIIKLEENKEPKNNFAIIFKENKITDNKLRKIAKEIWKKSNRKIGEINNIKITLDIEQKILFIKIHDINNKDYIYEIILS